MEFRNPQNSMYELSEDFYAWRVFWWFHSFLLCGISICQNWPNKENHWAYSSPHNYVSRNNEGVFRDRFEDGCVDLLEQIFILTKYFVGKLIVETSSVDFQNVLLRSDLYPQITMVMVPTQLSLGRLFVPMNPHNRVLRFSTSSAHTIGLKKEKGGSSKYQKNAIRRYELLML